MPSGQAPLPAPYREHSPPPALQPHFQCLWSSTVAPDYAGGFLVVPDGCVDIVCKGGQLLAVGPDRVAARPTLVPRSEEHTSELQSQSNLVCRLLLEKKKKQNRRLIHADTY